MYQVCVWIHILMATIWVGGLIYTAVVIVPYAVGQEPRERQRILRAFGRRFRWIGWGAIEVAVITGVGNLALRYPPVTISQLFNGQAFKARVAGEAAATWLPWKLGLVGLMIALMAFHDIASIRAAKRFEGSADRAPGNRAGTIAASLATLLAVAVVYVSVRLVRG